MDTKEEGTPRAISSIPTKKVGSRVRSPQQEAAGGQCVCVCVCVCVTSSWERELWGWGGTRPGDPHPTPHSLPKCTHLGHNREAAAGKQGQGQDPGSAGRASLSFTPAEEEGARKREEARKAGGGEAEVSQPGQSVPEGVFKNLERFD